MQTLSIQQFNLPTCPGPNCFCKTCDHDRIVKQNKAESNQVEGPVLYSAKVGT